VPAFARSHGVSNLRTFFSCTSTSTSTHTGGIELLSQQGARSTLLDHGPECRARLRLPSVDGKTFGLENLRKATTLVVMFLCNHCPYVQAVEDRIIQLHMDYAPRGVQLVGICSNDPTDYPDDRPERLLARWREKGHDFHT
jgi:hypothetical protein